MVFKVSKASDWNYESKVEIKSIEELLLFMEFNQSDVIIYRPRKYKDPNSYELCIYDYYVE